MAERIAVVAVIALLATPSSALGSRMPARARQCRYSNINGDRITRANDFQARGLRCADAFVLATGYTDSAASINLTVPGVEVFVAELSGLRYHWVCRTTELPRRELHDVGGVTHGSYFHCRAQEERAGRRLGAVYMSFKWWREGGGSRDCPGFALEKSGWRAGQVSLSRNLSCSHDKEWISTATRLLQTDGVPYATREVNGSVRRYYHYYDSNGTNSSNVPGDGVLYDCSEEDGPTTNGFPSEVWRGCFSASGGAELVEGVPEFPTGWQSTEYGWLVYHE